MNKDTFYIEAFGKKYPLNQKQLESSFTLNNALSGRFKETNTFPLKHTKDFEGGFNYIYSMLIKQDLTPKNLLASAAIADYLDIPAAKKSIKKYMKSTNAWEEEESPYVFYRNFSWLKDFTLKKIMLETKDYNKLPEEVLEDLRAIGAKTDKDEWIYTELKPVKVEELGHTGYNPTKIGPGYHYLEKDKPHGFLLKLTTSDGAVFYFLRVGDSISVRNDSFGNKNTKFFESKEGDIILAGKDKNFVFTDNYNVLFETDKGKKLIWVPESSPVWEYALDKIKPEPETIIGSGWQSDIHMIPQISIQPTY